LNNNGWKKLQEDDQRFFYMCIQKAAIRQEMVFVHVRKDAQSFQEKAHTHFFFGDQSKTPMKLLLMCIWRNLQQSSMWWRVLWKKLYECLKTQIIHDYNYYDNISTMSH
jgi:TRAP-type C4-dicarboxylate transport system substrate-binding protein